MFCFNVILKIFFAVALISTQFAVRITEKGVGRLVSRSTDRGDFMASRKILLLPPNISSFTSATKYFYISMPTNISSFLGTKYIILYICSNTLLPLKQKKWEYKDVSKICKLHFVTPRYCDKCSKLCLSSRGKKTVG